MFTASRTRLVSNCRDARVRFCCGAAASPDLAIHGLPQSGDRTVNRVYFGDVIQLYPYGYYTKLGNGSAILEWSVTKGSEFKGDVTIDKDKGILNVAGVGDFTVTLKRGVGEQQISTSVTVTDRKSVV